MLSELDPTNSTASNKSLQFGVRCSTWLHAQKSQARSGQIFICQFIVLGFIVLVGASEASPFVPNKQPGESGSRSEDSIQSIDCEYRKCTLISLSGISRSILNQIIWSDRICIEHSGNHSSQLHSSSSSVQVWIHADGQEGILTVVKNNCLFVNVGDLLEYFCQKNRKHNHINHGGSVSSEQDTIDSG
eukprot:4893244-Amphidinium_carterae.1